MSDEIEYRYVKGKGWVAGYKQTTRFNATATVHTDANGWQYSRFRIEDDPEGGITFVRID